MIQLTDSQQRQQDRALAGEFAEYAAKRAKCSTYMDYGTMAAAIIGDITVTSMMGMEARSTLAALTSVAIMGTGIVTSRWERQRLRHEFDQANTMLGPDARRDLRPIEEALPKNAPLDMKQELNPQNFENMLAYGLGAAALLLAGPLSMMAVVAISFLLKEKNVHKKTGEIATAVAARAPGPVGPP